MSRFCNIIDQHAEEKPDTPQVSQLNSKGRIFHELTRSQLALHSKIVGAHLLEKGLKPGDLVMIMYPITSVIDYLTAFVGCLRVGIVPVSIYPPNPAKLDIDLPKFQNFLDNSGATVAITTQEYKRFVQISSKLRKWPSQIKEWIATDVVVKNNKKPIKDFKNYETKSADLVFIQYTSGSTGDPKGVMIHFDSFINTMISISDYTNLQKHQSVFTWCPIYHDFGLIGNLQALFRGAHMHILDPISFLQNPILWPECLEKYKITHTYGPPFGYLLSTKRMKQQNKRYDLSRLEFVNTGAEPVTKESVDGILHVWGIKKENLVFGYGFAEACLLVTGSRGAIFDHETGVASAGTVDNPFHMKIVIAKDGIVLPDGETGSVMVQGPNIAQGYFRNPEKTKAAFENQFHGHEGFWYDSGDLGFIKNGHLFISGRLKDVIIVNGRNLYATDIERSLETLCQDLRPGCSACFQTGSDTAAIVCEPRPGKEIPLETLKNLKSSLDAEYGLQITDILCVSKGQVPKTTSGKLRRHECKKMWSEGQFKPVVQLEEIRKAENFMELLKQFDVTNFDATLVDNGVDSLKLSRLIEQSKEQFGIELDVTAIQAVPCKDLESVSKQGNKPHPAPCIPECNPKDRKMPFLLLLHTLAIVVLVGLVAACAIPAAAVQLALTDPQFLLNNASILDPLITTFKGGPGFILVVVPLTWMISYSIVVVIMKWILIGRYKKGSYAIWGYEFFKWWFMDRLFAIWEFSVGVHLLDTPYLNVFYILMGAKISLRSRLKTFLRETDLFEIEGDTIVSGVVNAQNVDIRGLTLDTIMVEKGTEIDSSSYIYPGSKLSWYKYSEETIHGPFRLAPFQPTPVFEGIQRVLYPLVALIIFGFCNYLMSYLTSFYDFSSYVQNAGRLVAIFFGSSFFLLLWTGIIVRFGLGTVFEFTNDKLASLACGFLYPWIIFSPWNQLIMIWIYGMDVSFSTVINECQCFSPSVTPYVSIGKGSFVSYTNVRATKEHPIKIGEKVTVGIHTVLEKGITICDRGSVATFAYLPPNTTVSSDQAYYSNSFSMFKEDPAILPSFAFNVWMLCVRVFIHWPLLFSTLAAPIVVGYYIHQSLDVQIYLKVFVITSAVLGSAGFTYMLVCLFLSHTCVPKPLGNGQERILKPGSWASYKYNVYLSIWGMAEVYIRLFFVGTYPWNLYLIMCGLDLQDYRKALLMGYSKDLQWWSIRNVDSDNDEERYEFNFVAQDMVNLGGHLGDGGVVKFQTTTYYGNVSIHTYNIPFGQQVGPNVTLTPRSNLRFYRKLTKTKSGIYSGNPGRECD
jgi:acyl-CoA synthetase (AMP-forming)/AMP-acid ligase II/acyl carrier protein